MFRLQLIHTLTRHKLFAGLLLAVGSLFLSHAAQAQAIAFQEAGFTGPAVHFPAGEWPIPGWMNDRVSSVLVHPDWRVTLFEHNNGGQPGGRARSYSSNTHYVGDEMNDRTSFIRVERNEVKVFQHANYEGASQAIGLGTTVNLGAVGGNQISSLTAPQGMVTTLYDFALGGGSGERRSYLRDVPNVGATMNDRASYIRVQEASELEVRSLRITIQTGGDDLRCNSQAYAIVRFRSGAQQRHPLNRGAQWNNHTTVSVDMPLPAGTTLSDLISFGLHFDSGRCGPFDTGDNWNVDRLLVEFASSESVGTLLERSGTPLVRFTENEVRDWNADTLVAAAFTRTFIHTATTANTSGHVTTLDHPLLNNNPRALVQVAQNWNPNGGTGVYNNAHIGVYYTGSRWAIFNQNFAALPPNASFNVTVEAASSTTRFVQQARLGNIAGHGTVIDHPLTNGNPHALLQVTANWNPNWNPASTGGVYNNHAIGVWYNGSKWEIFNQDFAAMPPNAAFNVAIQSSLSGADFIHRALPVNITLHRTVLDHPLANGNPRAKLMITPNWNPGGFGGVYNNHAMGVWYNGSRWEIFNQDFSAMPPNAAFNITIYRK